MRRARLLLTATAIAIGMTSAPAFAMVTTAPDVDVTLAPDDYTALATVDATETFSLQIPEIASNLDSLTAADSGSAAPVADISPSASCNFSVKLPIKGNHKTGTLSATPVGVQTCSWPSQHMDAQVTVYHSGTAVYHTPLVNCDESTTNLCTTVKSQGSHTCPSSCSGRWWATGVFNISAISGVALVGLDAECTFNSTTRYYRCAFTTNKVTV